MKYDFEHLCFNSDDILSFCLCNFQEVILYWHQYNLYFIHIVIIHLLRYLKFKSSNICIWMDGWMDIAMANTC